ncbi:MAG: hypothetical protein LBR53_10010 [Deltaproteobacteria bacterium]|jgi:hypothetical protein|nr:hypothetical protein [Deltaproteobacteria bacterium]
MSEKEKPPPRRCGFCGQPSNKKLRMFCSALGDANICEFCLRSFLSRERERARAGKAPAEPPAGDGAFCVFCRKEEDLLKGPGEPRLCRSCLARFGELVEEDDGGCPANEFVGGTAAPPLFWFDPRETSAEEESKDASGKDSRCSVCGKIGAVHSLFPAEGERLVLCLSCAETAHLALSRAADPARVSGAHCSRCGKDSSRDLPLLTFPGPAGLSLCVFCLKELLFIMLSARDGKAPLADRHPGPRGGKRRTAFRRHPKAASALPWEGRRNLDPLTWSRRTPESPDSDGVYCMFCRKNDGTLVSAKISGAHHPGGDVPWLICASCLEAFHRELEFSECPLPPEMAGTRCAVCGEELMTGSKCVIGPFPERRAICGDCVHVLWIVVGRHLERRG